MRYRRVTGRELNLHKLIPRFNNYHESKMHDK